MPYLVGTVILNQVRLEPKDGMWSQRGGILKAIKAEPVAAYTVHYVIAFFIDAS